MHTCGRYWELSSIPESQRKEMQLELEQHLAHAVRDGKSLEVVVGPNALAFAKSWPWEMPHQFPRGGVVILRWLVSAFLYLLLIELFEHLILRSPSFPFTLPTRSLLPS